MSQCHNGTGTGPMTQAVKPLALAATLSGPQNILHDQGRHQEERTMVEKHPISDTSGWKGPGTDKMPTRQHWHSVSSLGAPSLQRCVSVDRGTEHARCRQLVCRQAWAWGKCGILLICGPQTDSRCFQKLWHTLKGQSRDNLIHVDHHK